MPSAAPARRALGSEDDIADFLDAGGDTTITVGALVQQGVSAVLVGLLGLFALAGISTVSAPYSAASATTTTAVAGSVDVSRGEPIDSALDVEPAASTVDTTADLDDPSRNEDISRNSVRSELNKAVSQEMEQQRNGSLAQLQQQVAAGAQAAAADQRAEVLGGQSGAIAGEQARVQAQGAATAQLAREQAALAAGTLTSGSKSSGANPALDAALASIVSSSGCTTPMAPGSYIRGAGWGAYGSWSRYHTGVDLSASYGTPIRAACSGVVLAKDGGSWAGINVSIAHSGGGATLYAHMSAKTVRAGDVVKAGQIIGYVGLTGRTFGPHLHFEYYPTPSTIGDPYTSADPVSYMLRRGVRI